MSNRLLKLFEYPKSLFKGKFVWRDRIGSRNDVFSLFSTMDVELSPVCKSVLKKIIIFILN